MSAISDADVSIDASGNIRWTGGATTNRHTILEFIQWLMGKQDDEQASGNDLLDITIDTPFDRSTDQILTLNSPVNIDDTFALHLYDGSVSQTEPVVGGETLYSGLSVIGPVESGTEYMILQDGKVLPSFWGTGINPEIAPSLVFSRHLIKSKVGGVQIDGQRITVLARELGDQYRRFIVSLGTGSSVAAIGNGADIFNIKTDATLAGYTTVVNTEGFQELDIDNTGAAGQEFYSKWDKGTQSINDTYERTKFLTQRSHVADLTEGTPTGADFVIDNATIVGQGQSFKTVAGNQKITEVIARIKILAGAPTGLIYAELYDSDDVASQLSEPTGALLARSEVILASHITSSYEDVIFRFNRINPDTGVDQTIGQTLINGEYFIVFRHLDGDASNNFSLEGSSTDQDSTMNAASDTASVWTAVATDDINIIVKSSSPLHGMSGEQFQGINIEVGYDGETGGGVLEDGIVMWGTKINYDALTNGPFLPGEYITIKTGSTLKSGAVILYDDGVDEILVALDSPASSVLTDNDVITTIRGASETTATIAVTIVDDDKSGGTGILLAKDDNGADGELYLQVLSGSNPIDNNIIRKDDLLGNPLSDYVVATTTLNIRTVIPEFLGTSTGSNIIGAYGIGFQITDIGASDRFTSLDNASRVPPNNVVFTVSGLISGEDRVLVGPRTGSSLDRGQWLLSTALTGATETAVVVKTGTDTVNWPANEINWPATGQSGDVSALRIELDSGIYRNMDYDSHNSLNTFTIGSSDFSGALSAAVNNDVFLAFIDVLAGASEVTFIGVHAGVDRDLFVRVRDGGATPIKTFEATSAQFLSTPQTIAAVRTSDV